MWKHPDELAVAHPLTFSSHMVGTTADISIGETEVFQSSALQVFSTSGNILSANNGNELAL